MAWADMCNRMSDRVVATLNDGLAQYTGLGGSPVVADIAVMVDRNLMLNGPEGLFRSDAVGFSWRKDALGSVERGGLFSFGGATYVVEETITDDGYIVSAACMVQP